jgi:hypothetical protein
MQQWSVSVIVVALLGALPLCATAQQKSGDAAVVTSQSAPGKRTITRTQRVVATVESVDAKQRKLTLKGPQGTVLPVEASPDVRNFDQIKVGDRVVVRYHEALSLSLRKDGKEVRGATESSDGARAPAGQRPAGVVTETVKVTADVIGVDAKTQMVKLRGPKQTVELYVADPKQLKQIKVGDQVDAEYAQALAISVEPAPASSK